MQIFKKGTTVRYRQSGRVYHAVVTGVTNQTTLDLRVGNGSTKKVVTGATLVSHHGSATGFYQAR
jgi:hypothetical protein